MVIKGGVFNLVLGLSSNVLGRDVNGMWVLFIMLLGKFLFLRCCLCVSTVSLYTSGLELDLRNLMHSPLATDLYVEMG